jgi:hypothetical protein
MRGIWVVLILVVVAVAAYIGIFKRDWFMSKVEEAKRTAKGYTPAKTHTEALDKFQKAIEDRDYKSAAYYCGGEYASELKEGANGGTELATTIDSLLDSMKKYGVKTDNGTYVLRLFEPFPKKIKFEKVTHKEGEDKATAILIEDSDQLKEVNVRNRWKIDPQMIRPLVGGFGGAIQVTLKPEGSGDDKHWLIYFPENKSLHATVKHFNDKYDGYVTALRQLKQETIRDPGTKAAFESELRRKLEESK